MMSADRIVLWAPWMVLFMPLIGFTILAFVGGLAKRQGKQEGMMALATFCVFASFAFATACVWALFSRPEAAGADELRFVQPALPWNWIDVSGLTVRFSLLIDPLSCTLMLVITGIGFLIHLYSIGYMSHDEERVRYFSYLNLFTFFMLVLVTGGSLPLMFVGWEGVGLCSYLLIGFWFKKKSASDAGKKAFIVNRIGDAGLIIGMALAASTIGLDLMEISKAIGARHEELWVFGPLTLMALALFIGACGKSAQIPLHVWLPDAMEGPTPVSALIHAATMVTAGVYMVARLGTLFHASETAMLIVGSVGAVTAFVAATVALVQNDIKKVLAYSTVSQLGFMFLACGVDAFGVGVFHLYTHAFFKALMFLGAGSVIHALSGEQDMRHMGGLRTRTPWTFWTFTAGWLAIIGTPFFSGFFSKDEILVAAFGHNKLLFAIALFTAGLTAFYMTRLYVMTFLGEYRGSLEKAHGEHEAHGEEHGNHKADSHGHSGIHESPAVMLIPLIVLAVGSVFAGYFKVPEFVQPAIRVTEEALHVSWMPYLATSVAALGAWLAFLMYAGAMREVAAKLAAKYAGLKDLLDAKWGFDDAYDSFVRNGVNGVVDSSERVLWTKVDAGWIDGVVNGIGQLTLDLSEGGRAIQSGLVRGSALSILAGAVALLSAVLWAAR